MPTLPPDGAQVGADSFSHAHLSLAADDPVGAVTGLRVVIGEYERKREQPRQRQKKPLPPPSPEAPFPPVPSPDSEHHVNDYA